MVEVSTQPIVTSGGQVRQAGHRRMAGCYVRGLAGVFVPGGLDARDDADAEQDDDRCR